VPTIDLGDPLPDLSVTVRDAAGALANAGAVTLVVTLPDGTTSSPTVTNASTGTYTASYTPTQRGRHTAVWVATGANASAWTTTHNVVDPAAAIVGLADAQAFLGVYQPALADDVRQVVETSSAAVEGYCGRTWRRQTVVETYDGGRQTLLLRSTPVISITTVTESGTAVTSTGWVLDPAVGLLHRGTTISPSCWAYGVQNIVVTAVVGAASIPEPVRYAVLLTSRGLWAERQGGTQQVDADQYAAPADVIPRQARLLLEPLMAPGIA
jgi:hypothetical protein